MKSDPLRARLRRSASIVLLAMFGAALGLAGARRLQIDTNIAALLPKNTASEHAITVLRQRVTGAAPLYLLVRSPDAALNRRLAAQLRDEVAAWPETRWAITHRDAKTLLDARLLYLPATELERLAATTSERVEWEECASVPGCTNIDQRPELPSIATITKRLRTTTGLADLEHLLQDGARTQHNADREQATAPRNDTPEGELCSHDGTICAVQAYIAGDAGDLRFASEIFARSERLLRTTRPKTAPAQLQLAISGPYRNAPMIQRSIQRDLRTTAIVSTALLLLVVLTQFRTPRALVVVGFPLAVAIAITLGAVGFISLQLNMISAFALAILAGIGIDFGIHLLTHYQELRRKDMSASAAAEAAVAQLRRPLLAAGITTGCAFGALAAAQFRGFSQMGLIAGGGIAASLLAFIVLFRPLIELLDRLRPERQPPSPKTTVAMAIARRRPPSSRWAIAIFLSGIVAAAACGWSGRRVAFEQDFRRLQPPAVDHGIRTESVLHGSSGVQVYLLGTTNAALEDAARDLREHHVDGLVAADNAVVITPSTVVPPDQTRRLAAIAKLRHVVEHAQRRLKPSAAASLSDLRQWLEVRRPITARDLPPWLSGPLSEADGHFGRLGLVQLQLRGSDAKAMEALSTALARWRVRHPQVTFASSEALLGEVMPALRRDGVWIVGLALVGLLLAVAVIGRSLTRAVFVLLPVGLAIIATIGAMAALGMHLNLFNMLVLPVAFGVGVDGAIYVAWAVRQRHDRAEDRQHLRTSIRAILGSTATTIAGFGSLMLAHHPGLSSLGKLAVIAFSATLLANLVWLPAARTALGTLRRRSAQRIDEEKTYVTSDNPQTTR